MKQSTNVTIGHYILGKHPFFESSLYLQIQNLQKRHESDAFHISFILLLYLFWQDINICLFVLHHQQVNGIFNCFLLRC